MTPLSRQKSLIFSQRWEKSWEKLPNENKKCTSFTIHEEDALTKATKVTQKYYSKC